MKELEATRKEIESLRNLILIMTGKQKPKKPGKKSVADYRKLRGVSSFKNQIK